MRANGNVMQTFSNLVTYKLKAVSGPDCPHVDSQSREIAPQVCSDDSLARDSFGAIRAENVVFSSFSIRSLICTVRVQSAALHNVENVSVAILQTVIPAFVILLLK